ncbi:MULTISPECIES: molybdenum cofactor biosynthesis protein B [Marinobacter]|jgi:molybdenum cofactor biosynthesis protein B|uniref:molybdenum cofactor biosynthesis protein B n=1 Tax=Marinobacter TaxID=2742 RepID=UPI001108DEBA|nr:MULTISPECIES: molybdenum cofactor biosynthesis protein B [Marinobacter]MCK2150590.1 molybdenum cofactor biosynthesis protein B [Marinobacter alexandrii]
MSHASANAHFQPLDIAVLTVSDTRTLDNDQSGDTLQQRLVDAGHQLRERALVKDDIYAIRAVVSQWIASDQVPVILVTGGTGFSSRDSTPEALTPLFDKTVEGYGELFRHLSLASIGTSTIQSRAVAGLANRTLICAMPGAPRACALAWDEIIAPQLDVRHRPCNFVDQLSQKPRTPCASRSLSGVA